MPKTQRKNRDHSRSLGPLFIVVLAVVATACQECPQSTPNFVRPPIAETRVPSLQLGNLKQLAPGSVKDTDPPLCTSADKPDPNERSIGGLSSRAVYEFSSQPHLQDLYARLAMQMDVCTDKTLSSRDRSRLTAVLNFLKITNARSFAATLSQTGNANGGVKYPQVAPFSYAFDQAKSTYNVNTIGTSVIPWQVTTSFQVQYSYNASSNLSINTANLFSSIVTSVTGSGVATALLSPAANAYLSAGQAVLQDLAQSVFTQINTASDLNHFDMLQAVGGGGQDRSLTYRFRDLNNRPLAAVRLTVMFTNSIARTDPIDPTTDDSTHVPHFDALQNILGQPVGGPAGGQTLLQQISKEPSFQDLLKSTVDTPAQNFRSSCDQLETALQVTYGLNKYDTALAMGQILDVDTLYLGLKKFYNSGCFRSRGVLKLMGITAFDHEPSS